MIARIWHGRTPAEVAEEYLEYIRETGVPGQRSTPGNLGSVVFRRVGEENADFLVLSFWDSYDSIRTFAGEEMERAVYYPKDDRYLLEMEPTVEHFEVAAGEVPGAVKPGAEAA